MPIPGSWLACCGSLGESPPRYDLFSRRPVTPASTERFERRLEQCTREAGRAILESTLNQLEPVDPAGVATSFEHQGVSYRRNRRTKKMVDTRFGSVTIRRWFYQSVEPGSPGIAPLDVRLGLFADRMTPALAEVTGRLAADMTQQATLDMLDERFTVRPGVEAYRRIVADIATEVRTEHDQAAIDQLDAWIRQGRERPGDREVLLQVGRDGVFVQTRPCWEEASCGTLAVFDRGGRRLGTVYLGEMPEPDQPTMTERLTRVIQGVLAKSGEQLPTLRYVTDAGCHPQSYFREVLKKMKHPVTGERLKWSWGVDFFHACEYVSKIAGAIFGTASEKANRWAEEQRRTLRHDPKGVSRVIRRSAQQRRRTGLRGTAKDYCSGLNYLKRYREHMDFADRAARGEPIGSGITEAGCKVIFNQRLKQSGMRWNRATGQQIVDLRTANRGGLWQAIWARIIGRNATSPETTENIPSPNPLKREKCLLPA